MNQIKAVWAEQYDWRRDKIYLRHYYHKVGHIEKFAEALKELQEMAENVER